MIKSQKQIIMFAKVDEWKKSGMTIRAFAKSIGISRSCFEYWIRKKRNLNNRPPQFIELIPSDNPSVGKAQTVEIDKCTAQAQIVFTFPGGLCVKVYG